MNTGHLSLTELESRKQQQKVNIPTLVENPQILPVYATEEAAGADIKASINKEIPIPPGQSMLIPTGVRIALPKGYEIQIRPRSGLALKHQITVLNTPGTIDSDYRGEIAVILINHGIKEFIVAPGMRIAQLILAPVYQANFVICKNLNLTQRGNGGFGHTGSQ